MATLEINDLHVSVETENGPNEILHKIKLPELRERLEEAVEAELAVTGV